jgi:hypothetical protein
MVRPVSAVSLGVSAESVGEVAQALRRRSFRAGHGVTLLDRIGRRRKDMVACMAGIARDRAREDSRPDVDARAKCLDEVHHGDADVVIGRVFWGEAHAARCVEDEVEVRRIGHELVDVVAAQAACVCGGWTGGGTGIERGAGIGR